MPQRSNLFQDVVAIIHRHMAGDASVEESALLRNRVTGRPREVDVVIRSSVGGHQVTVAVEATSAGRGADGPWVERMLGKHANLATDTLVLVSEAGFTEEARGIAEAAGASTIAPEDLSSADPIGDVVNRLRSLWPKLLALTPERLRVEVERPDGTRIWFAAKSDHLLFLSDGSEVATLGEWVDRVLRKRFPEIAEGLGLRDITEDMDAFFELQTEGPHALIDGARVDTFVRYEEVDPPQFHRLTAVNVVGPAHIEVSEVELRHLRLGDVRLATGVTEMGNKDALLVVTETDEGERKFTLRLRDKPRRKAKPD